MLDFERESCCFRDGTDPQNQQLMTDLVRWVRATLDKVGCASSCGAGRALPVQRFMISGKSMSFCMSFACPPMRYYSGRYSSIWGDPRSWSRASR